MLKRINNSMGENPDDKKKRTPKNNSEKIGKDQIKQLLKEALQSDLLERSRKSIDNKVAISSTLEEFMKCFIVLGYDMNGNPINLVHANSQQDADSLSTAVNKFFVQNNNPDMF
jgi:hypothetical protein